MLKHGPGPAEAAMLRWCDGVGMVRLLAEEPDLLILEELTPGTPLAELEDESALRLAAGVMRAFWRPPPPEGFPSLHDWARGFSRVRLETDRAEGIYRELLASQAEPVLLHGDLHQHNILWSQERGWLAIDPQGVVGEPAYEVGALLRNPRERVLRLDLHRRIAVLAEELGFERERLRGWAYAQAMLAACWSLEDQDGEEQLWLAVAERFQRNG